MNKTITSYIEKNADDFLHLLKEVTTVPAPTHSEDERRARLQSEIRTRTGAEGRVDSTGNLVYTIAGKRPELFVLTAHMDTVFPHGTPLEMHQSAGKICCPGVCDNSLGVCALVWLVDYIHKQNITPEYTTIVAFNTCEEGLGDLAGIRRLIDDLCETRNIHFHAAIEGGTLGRITTRTIGSARYKVTVKTPGGHSYKDYGTPNAIIEAAHIIDDLNNIDLSIWPGSTFNIGTITGGNSVNSIAGRAEFTLEFRYQNAGSQHKIKPAADRVISAYMEDEIHITTECVGERPCGTLKHHVAADLLKEIHREMGITTTTDPGSTDSNYPLSKGIPSLTLGISNAEKTHTPDECLETGPIQKGLTQLFQWYIRYNRGE